MNSHLCRTLSRFSSSSSLSPLPLLRPSVAALPPRFSCSSSSYTSSSSSSSSPSSSSPSPIFKSLYNIENIYPGCNASDVANLLHHEFAKKYSVEVREKFNGYIPDRALLIRAMRSGGPGGQSANTSNTKVEVRFNVEEADWIPLWIKKQFLIEQKHRINKRNEFIITSEKTRTQLLNQADCVDRIRHYIREAEAAATPKEVDPEEEALAEKRKAKANERRLLEKRMKSYNSSMKGSV